MAEGGAAAKLGEVHRVFLHALAGSTNWCDIRIHGGMTDAERRARQDCRKAGLAESLGRLWRITPAGRAWLAAQARPRAAEEGVRHG